MNKLEGYVRLMRPVNCTMMGFAVIVGAAMALGFAVTDFWQNLTYGFITGFMLTASSMAINDYYDRETDAINEPNRPIPSKLIKPNEALVFALVLAAIGFAVAYLTDLIYLFCLVIAIIAWAISVTYTTVGKRSGLPGNLLVSVCVFIPFIYGSVAVVNTVELNVVIFVLMVFLSIMGREITKGIVDIQGDKTMNVKTLAVRYGDNTAAIVAVLFYVSAVFLSPVPWFLGIVSFWFIPFVAVTDVGLIASSIMLLKDFSRENARKIKNNVLIWFFFGLLAFIAGNIK